METKDIINSILRLSYLSGALEMTYTESEGEITEYTEALEEQKRLIEGLIDSENGIDQLGRWLKAKEEQDSILKDEAAKISRLRAANSKTIDFIKDIITSYMMSTGKEKITGELYSFAQYTSSKCSSNNDAIKEDFANVVEQVVRAAGVPDFVKVEVSGNNTVAKNMEQFPSDYFALSSKQTVKFNKPRKA